MLQVPGDGRVALSFLAQVFHHSDAVYSSIVSRDATQYLSAASCKVQEHIPMPVLKLVGIIVNYFEDSMTVTDLLDFKLL